MSLAAGTKLGPYEIVGAIGAGEMGKVCRARDARLARRIAEKSSSMLTIASEMNVVAVQLVRNG